MTFILKHVNVFIVFAITFQAALFAILFLRARKGNPEKILGYYELFYFLTYSSVLLYTLNEYFLFIFTYYLVIPFLCTFPVLFFLFIKKLARGTLKIKKDILHFVFPASTLLTNLIILPLLTYPEKYAIIIEKSIIDDEQALQNTFLVLHKIIYPLLLRLQLIIYIIFCLIEIRYLRKKIKEEYSYTKGINLKWAVEFLAIFTVLYVISLFLNNETFNYSFILLINLILGIEGIYYSNTYSELKNNLATVYSTEVQKNDKYFYSPLTEKEKSVLYDRIYEYVKVKKNYLNADLRLTDIAHALGTNRQYISQIINERTGKNFYYFVNEFRIKEFLERYKSEYFRNMTIEGISSTVGFKSKSSFFNAFKKINGCTPKEFMKDCKLPWKAS